MVLRRSYTLTSLLLFTGMGAIVLLALYLSWPLAAIGCGWVIWALWQAWQRHALRRHPEAIVALRLEDTGLACQYRSGVWRNGTVLSGGLVTAVLSVVRWRAAESATKAVVLVVCADAIDHEDYRRLRQHLRWRRADTVEGKNV